MTEREQVVFDTFVRCGTDKGNSHEYHPVYARIPSDIKRVLEIGIGGGQSLRAWLELFPNAEVWGLDQSRPGEMDVLEKDPRIHFIHSNIEDANTDELPMFDLIVDDGSHEYGNINTGIRKFYRHLIPGGTYVVEDVTLNALPLILAPVGSVCVKIKEGMDNRVVTWKAPAIESLPEINIENMEWETTSKT